jgi:hypothetical protein
VSNTIKAASLFAAGQAVAAGVISTRAAALAGGVLKSMLLSKLKAAGVLLLAVAALGIGASALPDRTVAAEPQSPVSKSAPAGPDDGNLKETVLALTQRLWEAHSKNDRTTFNNLLADDYVGLDISRREYTKAGALDYVAKYRVTEYSISNAKVIQLNATSAVVTYEVRFKIRSTGGKEEGPAVYHNSCAWAKRHGKWWAVFGESMLMTEDGGPSRVYRWRLSDGPLIEFGDGPDVKLPRKKD